MKRVLKILILIILSLVLAFIILKYNEMPKYITCILGLLMTISLFLIPFNIAFPSNKNECKTSDKEGFNEKKELKEYREYKKRMMKGIIIDGEYVKWKKAINSRNKKILSDENLSAELKKLMEYKVRDYRNAYNGLMGLCIPMIISTVTMLVSVDKSLGLNWTYAYIMISLYTISVTAILAKGLDYMKQQENFMNDCINALFLIDK